MAKHRHHHSTHRKSSRPKYTMAQVSQVLPFPNGSTYLPPSSTHPTEPRGMFSSLFSSSRDRISSIASHIHQGAGTMHNRAELNHNIVYAPADPPFTSGIAQPSQSFPPSQPLVNYNDQDYRPARSSSASQIYPRPPTIQNRPTALSESQPLRPPPMRIPQRHSIHEIHNDRDYIYGTQERPFQPPLRSHTYPPLRSILRNPSDMSDRHSYERPSAMSMTRSADGHDEEFHQSLRHYPSGGSLHRVGTPHPRSRSLERPLPGTIVRSSTPGEEPMLLLPPTRQRHTSQRERGYPDIPRNLGFEHLKQIAGDRCQCVFLTYDYGEEHPHLAYIASRMQRASEPLHLHRDADGVITMQRSDTGRLRTDLLQFIEHIDVLAGDAVEQDRDFAYRLPPKMMYDVLNLFRTPEDLDWIAEIIMRRKEGSNLSRTSHVLR